MSDDHEAPFDVAAYIERNAPPVCDEHDGGHRLGWANIRGFYGIEYLCGCAWGSDDGRGEGWSRHVGYDSRIGTRRERIGMSDDTETQYNSRPEAFPNIDTTHPGEINDLA